MCLKPQIKLYENQPIMLSLDPHYYCSFQLEGYDPVNI